ncbi:MAG: hypothetical protein IJ733_12275 [Lachnospiraceae bacterium]|nr:hypothetical protein [Lachnospiraceae bacterium]
MVKLLTFKMLSGYTRPVVSIAKDVTCLIDTGADTPVWTQGRETLNDVFEAERVEGKKFILSGFGKEPEIVDVYNISNVVLNDNNGERLIFKNMTVACTIRPNMVAHLILPATAFSHMNYTIRNVGVESPVIEIECSKDVYFVNPVYSTLDDKFVERVYSFTNG